MISKKTVLTRLCAAALVAACSTPSSAAGPTFWFRPVAPGSGAKSQSGGGTGQVSFSATLQDLPSSATTAQTVRGTIVPSAPATFSVKSSGGLQASVDGQGAVAIRATVVGAYRVVFTAVPTGAGSSVDFVVDVTVTAAASPRMTLTFPPAEVGKTYTAAATATDAEGGTFTWTAFPPGLSMAPDGSVTGTPTASGTFSPLVTVVATSGTVTSQGTVTVAPCPPVGVTAPSVVATVGGVYTGKVTVTGTAAYTLSTSPVLPSWLRLDATTGDLTGTPGSADKGEGSFQVIVTSDDGRSASTTVTVKVASPLPTVSLARLRTYGRAAQPLSVGSPELSDPSATVTAWSFEGVNPWAGNPGFVSNPDDCVDLTCETASVGSFSGSLNVLTQVPASYTVRFRATLVDGRSVISAAFVVAIEQSPPDTDFKLDVSGLSPTGKVGEGYLGTVYLSDTVDEASLTKSLVPEQGSSVPPGLSLSASAPFYDLGGTPTQAGTYLFRVSVTDTSTGRSGTSTVVRLTVGYPASGVANP